MNFIPALIKQCLQPARRDGTESLQSETSDGSPLPTLVEGNASNNGTVGFHAGQPAVPPPNVTLFISESDDTSNESSNPLNRDVHRQEMAIKENTESSNIVGSSSYDLETEGTAGKFSDSTDRSVQQQQLDSGKQVIDSNAPSVIPIESEPHSYSDTNCNQREHRSRGQEDTATSADQPVQNTSRTNRAETALSHDSTAVSQHADSSLPSINPQTNARINQANSSPEQPELTGARAAVTRPAVSSEDNKENLPEAATENTPPASSVAQELLHVRRPLQASPRSKSKEPPQVRIGHINVLIDDQASAKPRRSSSAKTPGPSIPFGLRGL